MKMIKRRRPPSGKIDMSSFTDTSIKISILDYTYNLINTIELNEKLLTQGLHCISINSRIKLVDSLFVFDHTDDSENNSLKEKHDDAAEDVLSPASLSSNIIRSIFKKKACFTLKDVRKYLTEYLAEEIKPLLENLLTKHSILLNTNVNKRNKLVELTGKYDLSFLNTDADINAVVHSAKKFNELNEPDKFISNINLLLWGESGTGKTEFAKYLAAKTGMGLIIKQSSDLMNMYVGQTEKLIREAFKEAEDKKSILFIDEADTFFGSRERAKASWEISHTNEFLVQMENFSGILICCTNLLEIFDTAAMRRFNWKVRFSPVLQTMRVPLYEKYFVNESSTLTPKQKKRVSNIEYLTPGHIKAVHQRRIFADTEIHDHDSIINEVEKEASYMKIRSTKRMGF
jgi:AAA+ superfamily predicted ATPase